MFVKPVFAAAAVFVAAAAFAAPASALTMKECGTKYQAAKADGTAKDMKWNDYRQKFCGQEAAAEEAADDKALAATSDKEPDRAMTAAPKGVTFPSAVDKKYADEKPSRARLKTCADAYHDNRDAGTLSGLRWIQKGGGYWSLCSAALKKGA